MKTLLFLIGTLITIQSCKEHEVNPTVFKGQVEFADNSELVTNGWVSIQGNGYGKPIDRALGIDSTFLDDAGKFNIKLEYNKNVDYYQLNFDYINKDGEGIILVSPQMDCSPFNCGDIKPGKVYELNIKIPR